jgi:hypothetical protein
MVRVMGEDLVELGQIDFIVSYECETFDCERSFRRDFRHNRLSAEILNGF